MHLCDCCQCDPSSSRLYIKRLRQQESSLNRVFSKEKKKPQSALKARRNKSPRQPPRCVPSLIRRISDAPLSKFYCPAPLRPILGRCKTQTLTRLRKDSAAPRSTRAACTWQALRPSSCRNLFSFFSCSSPCSRNLHAMIQP